MASESVDAITGEGLAMTFLQGEALASSLAKGGVEEYAAAHAGIGERPHSMGRLLLAMDYWRPAQTLGMRVLASEPTLLQELLQVHVGGGNLAGFVAKRGLSVAMGLLAGLRTATLANRTP